MSDAIARPRLVSLRAKYTWVDCPEIDYDDVSAEIRTNLSHGEREEFIDASNRIKRDLWDYLEGRIERAGKIDAAVRDAKTDKARAIALAKRNTFRDEQDIGTDPFRIRRIELVAPYIRDWNLGDVDPDGNLVKIMPPMEGGLMSFATVDEVVLAWLLEAIESGYRGGKGLRTQSSASASLPEPTNAPPTESDEASNG
jgi:hypothetical protein